MGSGVDIDLKFDINIEGDGDSDDSGVASSSKSSTETDYWSMDQEPLSVFDQAAQEVERNPDTRKFLLARVFGAPVTRILPCKTCCPLPFAPKMENGRKPRNFLGWTPEDYEMMTDTCPIHYVQSMMEEHEITKADREVQMLKSAKREKAAKLAAARQQAKMLAKSLVKAQAKEAKSLKKAKVEPAIEEEDSGYDYMYDPHGEGPSEPKRKKKQTRWLCPECTKSSKFGSAGCYSCGEWYHFACIGVKSAKQVPKNWICKWCQG